MLMKVYGRMIDYQSLIIKSKIIKVNMGAIDKILRNKTRKFKNHFFTKKLTNSLLHPNKNLFNVT